MGRSDTVTNWKEPPKPMVGAIRVSTPHRDTYKGQLICEGWRYTYNVEDLLLPTDQLVIGQWREIREELEARYPTPHPELERVIETPNNNAFQYLTYTLPVVRFYAQWGQETAELAKIQALVAEFGPLLITPSDRERLLDCSGYTTSALVSSRLIDSRYGRHMDLIRIDAKQAAGRVKSQKTKEKKRLAALEVQKSHTEISRAFSEIEHRITTKILEPVESLVGYPRILKLNRLVALGEKVVGKQFYRKIEGFDVFLSAWRGWDRELVLKVTGLEGDVVKWLDAEAEAMVRRTRKQKRAAKRRELEAATAETVSAGA